MLGTVDHVGYLCRDLEDAVEDFVSKFGLEVARRFERPEFSVLGVYLGPAEGNVELFTFGDRDLTERRLHGASIVLDHVAYEVNDIDAVAASLRRSGVRFAGPDLREELHEPVDLGGVRHLWTLPETSSGQRIQLLQR